MTAPLQREPGRRGRKPGPQVSEKRIQADGEQLLRMAGLRVHHISQPRASKQAIGYPDTYAIHRRLGLALFVEWKRPTGKQSPEQVEFQRDCEATRTPYLLGGLEVVREWLLSVGLAKQDGGQFILTPKRGSHAA